MRNGHRLYNTLGAESQAKVNRDFNFSVSRSTTFAVVASCVRLLRAPPSVATAPLSSRTLTGACSTFHWWAPPNVLSSKLSSLAFLQRYNQFLTWISLISSPLLAAATKMSHKPSEVMLLLVSTVIVANSRVWSDTPCDFCSFDGSSQKHLPERWVTCVLEWSQNVRNMVVHLNREWLKHLQLCFPLLNFCCDAILSD